MRIHRLATLTAISIAVSTFANAAADSADPETSTRPVHCLDLTRIRDTDIVDNKRILFETVHGTFVNELPHACAGLRPNEPYLVRTSLDRLCDLDIVTMLLPNGFGFTPGVSCGLGLFQPVTQAQVDMIKQEVSHHKS